MSPGFARLAGVTSLIAACALAAPAPARAAMVLTAAGTSAGLTLTTVATGFETTDPNGGLGPLGITVAPSGKLLVGTWPSGALYSINDVDNQVVGPAQIIATYGGGNAHSLATLGGSVYMVEKFANGGSLVRIDPATGAILQTLFTGIDPAAGVLGLVANPVTGHLIMATATQGIYDVNPTAVTRTQITPTSADGVSVSADGTIVYAAVSGTAILGFRVSDGAVVFNSGFVGGGPDGTAIGSAGVLANKLFANTNAGQLIQIDLITKVQTVLATGGSRGDFVYVDPTNGSLLLTQSASVLRITPRDGGFVGGNSVPEPSTLALAATAGLIGLIARRRRAAR